MSKLETKLNARSADFQANAAAMRALVDDLRQQFAKVEQGGGENIYPREIEEFLYRHPKIQDVQVIGVPDERFGEEICAWVRLRPGESANDEEIKAFCRGQIAHYKVPRYIKFVDEFPMTVTGKIQKFIMREHSIAELGLKIAKTA